MKKKVLIENVPYKLEAMKNCCSEASVEMLLNFYGIDISQKDIIEVCGKILHIPQKADDIGLEGIDKCLNKLSLLIEQKVKCQNSYFNFTKGEKNIEELKQFIDEGKPIIVRWQWKKTNPDGRHSVVVIGYEYEEDESGKRRVTNILYNDPSPVLKPTGKGRKMGVGEFMDLWKRTGYEILSCEKE